MSTTAIIVTSVALFSVATPVWYIPYRLCLQRLGHPRTRSGRVKRVTIIDWLSATGCGLFVGTMLLGLARWIAK